ncbi:MAG: ketopantoate reductase family protein [Alphaproteobacteria bacterium]
MDKKIAVLGTGANGSVISSDLVSAGLEITMIDMWAEHVEAMRANGLTVRYKDNVLNVPVNAYHLSDVCTFSEKFDVVLLVSKAYDAEWLAKLIEPHLADDGVLVAVQNAMTAEAVAAIVGVERTLGCVIELASQLFDPGDVRRSTGKDHTWFGVGAFDPSQERHIETVAELCAHTGSVEVIDEILSAKWVKLIVNAMIMGSMAVLGGTPEQVLQQNGPEFAARARKWFLQAGEEALAAGQALDYKVVPVFGLKPEDVTNTNNLLETLLDKILADIGPGPVNTSLQDLMKGRLCETDMIQGLVARECERSGRPAPVCAGITEMARQIHAGELEPGPENLERAGW